MDQHRSLEELDLRELQEVRSNLVGLLEHAGWKHLQKIAENQIKARQVEIYVPLTDIVGVLKQEFLKGEIAGINTFLAMIPNLIDFTNSLLQVKEEELANERSIQAINESSE